MEAIEAQEAKLTIVSNEPKRAALEMDLGEFELDLSQYYIDCGC